MITVVKSYKSVEIIIQQTKAILSFILVEIFSTIYQRADVKVVERLAKMSDCIPLLLKGLRCLGMHGFL